MHMNKINDTFIDIIILMNYHTKQISGVFIKL